MGGKRFQFGAGLVGALLGWVAILTMDAIGAFEGIALIPDSLHELACAALICGTVIAYARQLRTNRPAAESAPVVQDAAALTRAVEVGRILQERECEMATVTTLRSPQR